MKKLLLTAVIIVFSVASMQAQTFKIGGSVGVPLADVSDYSSVVLGADTYYYFTDVDAFIQIGLTAGFRTYIGKEVVFTDGPITVVIDDDRQFIPVAAAGRVKLFGLFSGGLDVGYAFGVSDNFDGGFYVRPVLGFDIADTIELNVSYESITTSTDTIFGDVTYGNLNVGVLFQL